MERLIPRLDSACCRSEDPKQPTRPAPTRYRVVNATSTTCAFMRACTVAAGSGGQDPHPAAGAHGRDLTGSAARGFGGLEDRPSGVEREDFVVRPQARLALADDLRLLSHPGGCRSAQCRASWFACALFHQPLGNWSSRLPVLSVWRAPVAGLEAPPDGSLIAKHGR